MAKNPDVLIVGAGPVGLTLALVLAEHKVPFRIIDKREHWSAASKALTITPKTLEALGLIGVAYQFVEEGIQSRYINFYDFKRRGIASLNFSTIVSPYPFMLQLPQNTSTSILVDALAKKGIQVERPVILQNIVDSGHNCDCILYDPRTTTVSEVRVKYVIGCDGANSAVREITGEKFVGGNAPEAFVMADLKLRHHDFKNERYLFYLKKKSSLYVMPMKNGYYRIISTTQKPVNEIDDAHVLEHFGKIFKDLGLKEIELSDPLWISTFNPRQFIVNNYVKRSVILAGDAAHIQSPVGSQGLNTGIQDAINLGWKLAFVLKSLNEKQLLASYHEERREIALKLFRYNDRLNKSVFGSNRISRELSIKKRYLLRIPHFQNKEKRIVSQLHICYENYHSLQNILSDIACQPSGYRYLKPGHRFPSLELSSNGDKTKAYTLLSILKYTLFVFTDDVPAASAVLSDIDKEKCNVVFLVSKSDGQRYHDATFVVYELGKRIYHHKRHMLCLVRPDSYIDYVGTIQ